MNARCMHPGGRSKTTYRSPAKARRAARLAQGGTRDVLVGRAFYVYQCPACSLWHISSQARRS